MRKPCLSYMSWRTINFSFGYGYWGSSDSTTPTLCLAEFYAAFSDSTRCWDQTAWWASGNVSTEQWYSFTQDFKHREVPDWTKQKPSRLPALGLDFHRAALQPASAGEFRFHHTPNSGAMSPFAQVLTVALSQCIVFPAISPPRYTKTTWFLFVQISSPSCGLRKNQIHLHRYYTHFRKPVACIQMIFICL